MDVLVRSLHDVLSRSLRFVMLSNFSRSSRFVTHKMLRSLKSLLVLASLSHRLVDLWTLREIRNALAHLPSFARRRRKWKTNW